MKKKERVIVKAKKWNNSTNVLFLMEADDFRLKEYANNYSVITAGVHDVKDRKVQRNGYTATKFTGANGKIYRVFHDYSAITSKS